MPSSADLKTHSLCFPVVRGGESPSLVFHCPWQFPAAYFPGFGRLGMELRSLLDCRSESDVLRGFPFSYHKCSVFAVGDCRLSSINSFPSRNVDESGPGLEEIARPPECVTRSPSLLVSQASGDSLLFLFTPCELAAVHFFTIYSGLTCPGRCRYVPRLPLLVISP